MARGNFLKYRLEATATINGESVCEGVDCETADRVRHQIATLQGNVERLGGELQFVGVMLRKTKTKFAGRYILFWQRLMDGSTIGSLEFTSN